MLTNDQVAEKVHKILQEFLGVDPATLKPETNLTEDLDTDSLDLIELTMALEEEFNIEILDDQAEKIKTIQDACDLVIKMRSS